MSEDEPDNAATVIASDPAFAALEASGAPIVALAGEPLRAVYANASAKAVFGDDPGERMLAEPGDDARPLRDIVERVRNGAAPRLERLPIPLRDQVRTVTILCRRLSGEGAEAVVVLAALGLRAASAPAPQPAKAQEPEPVQEEEPADGEQPRLEPPRVEASTRSRLLDRHGLIAPRFLWKTDAAGRFVDITHVLSDVVGQKYSDLLGREVGELSRELGLGADFAAALASEKSWSGVEVDWPIEDPPARAPTLLGALPIHDAARRFVGFQGYGVIKLSEAVLCAPGARPAPASGRPAQNSGTAAEEAAGIAAGPDDSSPDAAHPAPNVVALRPASQPREGSRNGQALSAQEQSAFDEIARTLNFSGASAAATPGPARELIDQIGRAIGGVAPPAGAGEPPDRSAALIDKLPVGVLIARGSEALYANRTLLDYLGYENLESLAADGGLARLFLGRAPQSLTSAAPCSAVEIRAQDGETLGTDAHFQIVEWEGTPATLISFRRHLASTPPGAEEIAARALARTQAAELSHLRLKNEELAASFAASPAPAAVLNRKGEIERANPAFADLIGLEKGAGENHKLVRYLTGEDALRLAGLFGEASDSRAPSGTEQRDFDRLSAGSRPVSIRLLGFGDPARFLCFAASGAQPLAPSPEADAAREEAERANAAKSEFLARVSHEIRTPLNAIIGFAEVMMEERFGPIGSERYKEYLKDVHTSGVHVLSLVNDLLDLSKIEAGKLELVVEEVDLNAIVAECVSIMQTQANQHRVVVRLSLAPRLPRIRADERSLRQILLNLLSNAVKFNEAGGQVIVSSALTDAGYVVIRVKDTGIGMSDDEIQLALEPFRQVETSRKNWGTGLGLPVTKALIEANHASFLIKSRKNEGTLVEVAFPTAQGLAAE
ncbi:sensor histidine kinase [Methylocystis heyeri]|uniref:histidine kinase n=1 Tax=Methylocystis heyeri TaxID=391905 RepID=A0A6B8KFW5_9HYPH|nr:HAMP domain-containing sensor histidine kinase [Methylocystis heyeri]QGM47294.1 PAS domain-containing protein [Methylocystis heyeri]